MWTQSECRMQNADEETTDYTDGHGWRDGDAGQDADGEQQIKCITVIHLIRGCAVTSCDFHDARFERWTGGKDHPAIEAKQRLNRRQRRASPAIRFPVARAIGLCGSVRVQGRSADIPVCGFWGL